MANRSLIHSGCNSSLLRAAAAFIERVSQYSEVVVAASTRAAADEVSRSVSGSGSLGVHRMSLVQMAAEVASESVAVRGLAPVTALGMEALAARVASMLQRDHRLLYFGPVANTPGFARALAATLSDFGCSR